MSEDFGEAELHEVADAEGGDLDELPVLDPQDVELERAELVAPRFTATASGCSGAVTSSNNASGYGCSHGTFANDVIDVSRRDFDRGTKRRPPPKLIGASMSFSVGERGGADEPVADHCDEAVGLLHHRHVPARVELHERPVLALRRERPGEPDRHQPVAPSVHDQRR